MFKNLIELIKVKSIMTLMFSVVFCILSYTGKISTKDFMLVFSVIITYYFSKGSNT